LADGNIAAPLRRCQRHTANRAAEAAANATPSSAGAKPSAAAANLQL